MRGSARRFQRSLRRLFKKRRDEALYAWLDWAHHWSWDNWPEPHRLYNSTYCFRTRTVRFIRLTEEEATRQEEMTDAIEREYAQERPDVL